MAGSVSLTSRPRLGNRSPRVHTEAVSAPAVRRARARRGSGDLLREEIVTAAKRLLADADRADDVPMRAVAEAVGVTTPSIYLHFADKQELLSAVVADVFGELDDAMVATGGIRAGECSARLCRPPALKWCSRRDVRRRPSRVAVCTK